MIEANNFYFYFFYSSVAVKVVKLEKQKQAERIQPSADPALLLLMSYLNITTHLSAYVSEQLQNYPFLETHERSSSILVQDLSTFWPENCNNTILTAK